MERGQALHPGQEGPAAGSLKQERRELDKALEFSERLFNRGLFFEAHEHLEGFWRQARGERKIFLQGLIQVAAAFHKLKASPQSLGGARELLEKGLSKLERTAGAPAAVEALRPVLEKLRAGKAPKGPPRLRWSRLGL